MGRHAVLSSGARVDTPLVVRTAGMPGRVLASLRFEASFKAASDVAWRRERLEATGGGLADELYRVIGALPSSRNRAALVGLRRALHRARRPRAPEWNDAAAAALPIRLRQRIREWVDQRDELDRRSAELPRVLAEEEVDKQEVLRGVARSPWFRRALSQASPPLSGQLRTWLADGSDVPQRQSLVRLAKYVARAAAKTSPYSTFTVSGIGRWVDDGPPVRLGTPQRVCGVLELDGLLVERLVRSLRDDPDLASPRLRVNPSAVIADGRVSFAGRPPDEPIVTLPATPAIRACLRLLDARPGLAWEDLREALAAQGGASAATVERFLADLTESGLLERVAPIADLSVDPLGELASWLTAHRGERPARVVAQLSRLRDEIRRDVPVADVDGHEARQQAVTRAMSDLADSRDGLPEIDERAHKWIFHESAVSPGPEAECSLAAWGPALDDLDVIGRWLAPFDPRLPLRLALAAYVRDRFGTGAVVPVLTLHRAVQEAIHDCGPEDRPSAASELARLFQVRPDLAWVPADSPLPRVQELTEIQRRAGELALGGRRVDGVVHATPSDVVAQAAGWPAWIAAAEAFSCYVQVLGDEPGARLVLNAVGRGYGRGRSRLTYLLAQSGSATPPATVWPDSGGEPMRAELGGLFSSSANLRTPCVPYELDYPFVTSARPDAERIRVGDCVAVHEPETDLVRLRAGSDGAEVVPLQLGMLADGFLPPLARLLVRAFGRGFSVNPGLPPAVAAAAGELTVPEAVAAHPRVEVGKVVLRRACWVAPVGQIPDRERGESDAGYWVRLLRWLGVHDIPMQCFVRIVAGDVAAEVDADRDGHARLLDKSRKPLYVDFTNWYLVLVFQRTLPGSGSVVVFEEALPVPEDARFPAEDPAATEFLVEISRSGGA